MKVAQKVAEQLQRFPEGFIFGYQTLALESKEYQAASKTMERLILKGQIQRVSKGFFYKPKQTLFGTLKPDETEVLKQFLFKKGQRIAYISGSSLYYQMGLTMQIPTQITIACSSRRDWSIRSLLTIQYTKSYVQATDENYHCLGILDALKDFKRIPDLNPSVFVPVIARHLEGLTPILRSKMVEYALLYPPRVRALLGAFLELFSDNRALTRLKNSLNPLSTYDFGLNPSLLPTAHNWFLN